MVPLDRNNRVLVEAGLRRIRAGRASAGIAALFEVAGRDPPAASTRDLGYAIGPRVNAAGRLEDIALGLRCLLADDPAQALDLARRLDAINRQRRDLQADMTAQAIDHVAGIGDDRHGLVVHDAGWHAGVVGLIAGKLKERHQRPVVALAPAGDDSGLWRGSARSIDGVHVRDVLAAIDTAQPGLIVRFGGHAMAAGLSIEAGAISGFASAFDAAVRRALGGDAPHEALWSDGPLGRDELTLETAELLATAVPWGQAFPPPLFDDEVEVISQRVVGSRHLRLRVRTADGALADAIAFGRADAGPMPRHARIAYEIGVDDWGGERRVQLLLRHDEPV
jgi:single-stranded-DNA-specific exonuclease